MTEPTRCTSTRVRPSSSWLMNHIYIYIYTSFAHRKTASKYIKMSLKSRHWHKRPPDHYTCNGTRNMTLSKAYIPSTHPSSTASNSTKRSNYVEEVSLNDGALCTTPPNRGAQLIGATQFGSIRRLGGQLLCGISQRDVFLWSLMSFGLELTDRGFRRVLPIFNVSLRSAGNFAYNYVIKSIGQHIKNEKKCCYFNWNLRNLSLFSKKWFCTTY